MITHAREGRASRLLHDAIAGASVALILIPQSMAYAELAGLPAHLGLYAAALPPIAAALFASSPYLQTGPVALTALLTLGALIPLAPRGTEEFVGLAALLALVVGVVRMVIGFVRAGGIAYLMSQPVLEGFTSAAAILIVLSQLPTALGVSEPSTGVVASAWWAVFHPEEWRASSIAFAAMAVFVIYGARRSHPLIPGVLIATAGGLLISLWTGYEGAKLGVVPTGGLPGLPGDLPWLRLPSLLVPGLVIAVVGFAETTSIAQSFAAKDRRPWDPSRDFFGQGIANVVAGFSGGFPVGGSFTRSSLNRMSGARTRWSGAVTGLVVLMFLPFASVLAPLPRAVLAGIVISAVATLIEVGDLVRIWKFSKPQAVVGWTTFLMTLALVPRLEQAVLMGVLLALGVHLWRERDMKLQTWSAEGALHLAPRGVLWFGTAPEMEQAISHAFGETVDLREVVFHLGGVGRLDFTGALLLERVIQEAHEAGLDTRFDGVPPHAERILRRVFGWTRSEPRVEPSSAAAESDPKAGSP